MKKFFDYFKSQPQEKKSFYAYASNDYNNGVDNLYSFGRDNLSFYRALEYYRRCAPLHSAIQLITDEVSNIDPYLYNSNDDQYSNRGKLLDLLRFPNADSTYTEFMAQLASFFLITGNAYVLAAAISPTRPVKELCVIPPQFVTLIAGKDGVVDVMNINMDNSRAESFKRIEVNGRYRYYSEEGRELWHIKEFNPFQSASNPYGMSKLTPIFYEIEQYINSSVHNLSMLKRGARPSGALTSEQPLNDDQFMRLQEQMSAFYQGATNTGRMLLLENGIHFEEMAQNNKDMDFLELKKNVTFMIYNALKIPLPLISADHTTMNNMQHAMLNFYDNNILPLLERLLTELSIFLEPRYPELKTQVLSYSADEITALEPRRNEQLEKLAAMGVLTINEIRASMGYEPLTGGNTLYISSNQMPVGQDVYTEDQPKVPRSQDLDEPIEEAPVDELAEAKQQFIQILREQKNPNNTPKYSESFIHEMVSKYYAIPKI